MEAEGGVLELTDLLIACTCPQSVTPAAFCGTQEISCLANITKSGAKSRTVFVGNVRRWIKKAVNLGP